MKVIKGTPPLSPGCCIVCRRGVPHEYVDTEYDTPDGFDRVYICKACALELGAFFGMVPKEEYEEAIQKLIFHEQRYKKLKDLVQAYTYVLQSVKTVFKESSIKHGLIDPDLPIEDQVDEAYTKKTENKKKAKEAV